MKPTEIPDGWNQATPVEARTHEAELKREAGEEHPLHRVSVQCLASRSDCEQVVFALFGHEHELAVVHLGSVGHGSSTLPITHFFRDTTTFLREWRDALD